MKIIISGSPGFDDYEFMKARADEFIRKSKAVTVEILSSGERGASMFGEWYAQERGYPLRTFASAEKMAACANAALVFWDGKDAGDLGMAIAAQNKGLKTKLYCNCREEGE